MADVRWLCHKSHVTCLPRARLLCYLTGGFACLLMKGALCVVAQSHQQHVLTWWVIRARPCRATSGSVCWSGEVIHCLSRVACSLLLLGFASCCALVEHPGGCSEQTVAQSDGVGVSNMKRTV